MVEKELPVPECYLKVLEIFTSKKFPFVIIGGAAMALHGIPRTTLDIDIIIPAEKQVVIKLFQVLSQVGLQSEEEQILKLLDKPSLLYDQWLTFQDNKQREIIDVLLEKPANFNKIFKRSILRKSKKLSVHIASLKDIIKMKKISGRSIDLSDLILIQERLKLTKEK